MLIINSDQIKHHFLELICVGTSGFQRPGHIFTTQVTIQTYTQVLAVHCHSHITPAQYTANF